MIEKLIRFAKEHYPDFYQLPDAFLRKLFETYQETTLVYEQQGKIKGYAVYQEWPDRLVFIAIVGTGTKEENLRAMLKGRHELPAKMICYFDEEKMELKTCRQPQQAG